LKSVDRCVICSSQRILTFDAKVSPFLAERIWQKESFGVGFCYCRNCTFSFFNPRLEADELLHLYSNYRDQDYQRMRQRHEASYSIEINQSIGNDAEEIRIRKDILFRMLTAVADISSMKNVLDYGGDRGQFILDQFSRVERYVYEISGVEPLSGVTKLANMDECRKRTYDFIMCCHVLEHVPAPMEEMKNIVSLAHKGTIIYLEIPEDSTWDTPFRKYVFSAFGMLLRLLPSMADFAKRFLKYPSQMHEHINFFTSKSMKKLVEEAGLKLLSMETPDIKIGPMKLRILGCLAEVQ